jgi:hypothetical protein
MLFATRLASVHLCMLTLGGAKTPPFFVFAPAIPPKSHKQKEAQARVPVLLRLLRVFV